MRVKILGSAAGGGFPQWNCACVNCFALRCGAFKGKPRSQCQVAISPDGRRWTLLNASPDLRHQLASCPELHPAGGRRHTPISDVILTSADVDHVAGLLQLRESQYFRIHARPAVRRLLCEGNSMFQALSQYDGQTEWRELTSRRELFDGVDVRVASAGTRFPPYARASTGGLDPSEAVTGLLFEARSPWRRLCYLPQVARLTEQLRSWLESADVILFDGTFWSEDELGEVREGAPTASEMGHLPVGGANGSLELLRGLRRARKIFIHVNNTNPILDEMSPERSQVREAGWQVAEDGMELEL